MALSRLTPARKPPTAEKPARSLKSGGQRSVVAGHTGMVILLFTDLRQAIRDAGNEVPAMV